MIPTRIAYMAVGCACVVLVMRGRTQADMAYDDVGPAMHCVDSSTAVAFMAPPKREQEAGVAIQSAVYLKHVGDSDKPIFPIVIAIGPPSPANLERILGKDDGAEHATIITVSNEDFGKILSEFAKLLSQKIDVPKEPRFGTFQIVVEEGPSAQQRILPKDKTQIVREFSRTEMVDVLRILAKVEKESTQVNEVLKSTTASLKRRLGLEVAP